jgi:hypothetical protein
MIFLPKHDHHESRKTLNFVSTPAPTTQFLFNTNERVRKSAIAVTHSKQTADFPLDADETRKMSAIAVTHPKSTTAKISIRYKLKLRDTRPLPKKIANSALRAPRA